MIEEKSTTFPTWQNLMFAFSKSPVKPNDVDHLFDYWMHESNQRKIRGAKYWEGAPD